MGVLLGSKKTSFIQSTSLETRVTSKNVPIFIVVRMEIG
jgi:hypothetical protein